MLQNEITYSELITKYLVNYWLFYNFITTFTCRTIYRNCFTRRNRRNQFM